MRYPCVSDDAEMRLQAPEALAFTVPASVPSRVTNTEIPTSVKSPG